MILEYIKSEDDYLIEEEFEAKVTDYYLSEDSIDILSNYIADKTYSEDYEIIPERLIVHKINSNEYKMLIDSKEVNNFRLPYHMISVTAPRDNPAQLNITQIIVKRGLDKFLLFYENQIENAWKKY